MTVTAATITWQSIIYRNKDPRDCETFRKFITLTNKRFTLEKINLLKRDMEEKSGEYSFKQQRIMFNIQINGIFHLKIKAYAKCLGKHFIRC